MQNHSVQPVIEHPKRIWHSSHQRPLQHHENEVHCPELQARHETGRSLLAFSCLFVKKRFKGDERMHVC